MTTDSLLAFLGWCSVINLGVLIFSSVMLMACRGWVMAMHSKMFGLEEKELGSLYFRFLAYYKIVVIAFNLVPYFALRIIV
ncbi:MAG: DUF6868 family protein [Verrucomicrobiales bacterium]